MAKIDTILAHAEKTCRERGVKLTAKRRQVLAGLLSEGRALSAYELVDVCRERFDTPIPVMSAYRILAFLEGENLVHKLHLANKYVACSHISCDHAHEVPQFLICDQCGSVKEIGIQKSLINRLRQDVAKADYVLQSPQLELHCLCKACAAEKAVS
ncbi:Fur family transcriptional regulator [Parahaliea mediterranea]|uniref:Transcriptional repressor n=1 Tax=Parahaliea mediterranea TaxID=651086 RepID=A0A939DHY9_9GAMM|nr:Fur family transcriptional regulator [Parahaliea mediterranea]MBN7798358.1 transcriptional repressor [Parahaliea mediterranea]